MAKWYSVVRRVRCPLINSLIADGMSHKYKEFPFDQTFAQRNMYVIDGYWFLDEEKDEIQRNNFRKLFAKDSRFLLKMLADAHSEWNEFEKYAKHLRVKDFSKNNNAELKGDFDKVSLFIRSWVNLYLQFGWLLEKVMELKLKQILEKRALNKMQENFSLLTVPMRRGNFEDSNLQLLEIIEEINVNAKLKKLFEKAPGEIASGLKNYPEIEHLVLLYVERFGWLGNSDFNSIFWNKETACKQIKEKLAGGITSLKEQELEYEKREAAIEKLMKDLNFNDEEKIMVQSTRELVHFRSFRTDVLWKLGWYCRPLFAEIAKRITVDFSDFSNLLFFEISDALGGKAIDEKIVEKRKRDYAIVVVEGNIEYFYDKSKIDKLKREFNVGVTQLVGELKGSIAFTGKAIGIAKIVNSVSDLEKVQKGDVLVTIMTKPAYISAMQRAVAFVTDEGGILCHAAIIAREMKKPCVIATRNATQVFKDGDRIEVDAVNGVVRKL
ncbi:MAG: PEP-utilizing enzyme [Candidatus Micrarchaeota archaeon]